MDAREIIARAIDPQIFAIAPDVMVEGKRRAFAHADKILAALAANQLAVVGREPTEAQLDQAQEECGYILGGLNVDGDYLKLSQNIWRAMIHIAISPSPVSTGDRR